VRHRQVHGARSYRTSLFETDEVPLRKGGTGTAWSVDSEFPQQRRRMAAQISAVADPFDEGSKDHAFEALPVQSGKQMFRFLRTRKHVGIFNSDFVHVKANEGLIHFGYVRDHWYRVLWRAKLAEKLRSGRDRLSQCQRELRLSVEGWRAYGGQRLRGHQTADQGFRNLPGRPILLNCG
jgi:hypothetical protein